MRLVTLLILIGGLIGCVYMAWHFTRLPFFKNIKMTKRWVPWIVCVPICMVIWYFSFVYYTYLMAFSVYSLGIFAITDIFWLIISRTPKLKNSKLTAFWRRRMYNEVIIIVVCVVITILGSINADNVQETKYDININKIVKEEPLKIVSIGDMHIGTGVYGRDIDELDEKVNKLNPDVVCLVGDIFDERTTKEEMKILEKSLKNIKTQYGIYYVYGNHDLGKYARKHKWSKKDVVNTLEKGNVKILEDKSILIDNRFYLVGRKDYSMTAVPEREEDRKTVKELTDPLNKKYPIILMDHRPFEIKKAKNVGVDLQLSGHTHANQLGPAGTLDELFLHLNEVVYGHKKDGNYNIIVTSGYGTWGMPVRVGSPCEIVNVSLTGI